MVVNDPMLYVQGNTPSVFMGGTDIFIGGVKIVITSGELCVT